MILVCGLATLPADTGLSNKHFVINNSVEIVFKLQPTFKDRGDIFMKSRGLERTRI
jgi:hypothetical protein